MPELIGRLYAEGRGRISDLVRDADVETTVPHCPEWTVRELVAHLTGVCADIVGGHLEGVATEPWTARQVEERKERSIAEIVDEWSDVGPQCEEIAQHFGGAERQWLGDMITHEHDIRTALGQPGARDNDAIAESLPWFAENLGKGMTPALRIVTAEGDDFTMGDGEPTATLRAPRFEVFRAVTGRRTAEQIAALDWDGDHAEHLGAFGRGPFTVATTAVAE